MTTTHRAEVIGSLLRPDYLKRARDQWQDGRMPTHEFKEVEDRAVGEAIALHEATGVDVVTDGEMRRLFFSGSLTEAIDGVEPTPPDPDRAVQWHEKSTEDSWEWQMPWSVTDRIALRRSLAAEEFTFARAKTSKPIKVTLPSPLMLAPFWSRQHSAGAYAGPFELCADAVDLLRQEVQRLADLGCEYVQIDAPELTSALEQSRGWWEDTIGVSVDRVLSEGMDLVEAVAQGFPELTFGLHLCRGNNEGRWLSEGGYESISRAVFGQARSYDVFLLEYDDYRSGSFEALADVPEDKTVVLGLVSTKRSEIEDAGALEARIDEASRYFPREQLALSTQCGFASVAKGNPIDEGAQEAKLRLVAEVAHRVWS